MKSKTARRTVLSTLGLALGAFYGLPDAAAQDIYLEQGGIVAIEAETASATGWLQHAPDSGITGAQGDAMRFTDGGSICSSTEAAAKAFPALRYHLRIETAGTYRLSFNIHKQVHCVEVSDPSQLSTCHEGAQCESLGIQSEGDTCPADKCWRSDISNDSYVKIVTSDGAPVGWVAESYTDITKLYGGSGDKYSWSGANALDYGGTKHAPDWDFAPGDYVLEVRGRSRGFSFDRLVFRASSVSDSDARNAPQSPIADPTGLGSGGTSGSGGETGTGGTIGSGGAPGSPTGTGATEGIGATGGTGTGTTDGSDPIVDEVEGTGAGDDSPGGDSEGSSDSGSCAFQGPSSGHGGWLLTGLLLLAFGAMRRRSWARSS